MATISEQPVWEDDVYLIARGDRVEGGRDGVANRQASQLSNRTAFLREQIKSLIDDGVMFSRDYRKEIITLTRHGQAIIKDDFLYYLRDSAPLPYVTTGTTDASWAVDSPFFTSVSDPNLRKNLGSEGGSQLIFGLGNIIGTTSQILSSTDTPDAYQSNGFYAQNDGGEGVWRFTGKTAPARAGTHVITQGKVYNAKGNEYALEICRGSIIVLANGAKAYTYDECTDQTTDDFVCLGQASNGILSRLTLGVSTGNNVATYDGGARLDLIYPTNMYRIGKEPIKGYSGVNYRFGSSYLMVYAGKSYTYAMTGKRLDGWRHGVPEIEEKWRAVNKQEYWGSLSLQNCHIYGGTWDGDHTIRKMPEQCSAGVAILALNPEGFFTHGVTIKSTFNWAQVEMPAMLEPTKFNRDGHAFDNNELDYEYITSAIAASGATRRAGNFNRVVHDGSKFEGGRRGTYRNACDWTALYNTEVTMRQAWRSANNVSGTLPEYIAVMTGTGLHVSGGYWGPAAAKDYNAKNGVVYGTAQNHVFTGVYNEWTYNFYTVSRWGFIGKASRLLGLHFDCVSMYKDNFTEYSNVRFEGGCFPSVDDGGNAKYHDDFWHYDTPNGVSTFIWGNPVRDLGAFRHTGFDFRYGTNNMYIPAGTDWDSIRNRPYAKEMFNPNGLQLNAGPAMAPWQQPSIKSEICIWIKDHTGNFNPRNIYAWVTAASQDGPNADEALYKSFAEPFIDFGNGYRMLKITNKRLTAWDGLYTYARNTGIYFDVPADGSTPITIKAIEAYTGGVPMFPTGCGNYIPEANGNSVLSPATNPVGLDSSLGGGLFFPGDIIGPWSHVRRTQSGYIISPTLTPGYTLDRKMVTGGCTLEAAFKVAFSATVETVNSNGTTIITVPAAFLPYIAVGIPLYITGGSSTSVTGQVQLIKRLLNSDGTSSPRYLVQGTVGAVGDTLTIDQAKVPAYTFYNDRNFNAVTASSVTVNGVSVATAHRSTVSMGIGYGGASGVKAAEWYFNGGITPSHRLVASSASGMTLEAGGNFSVVGNTFPAADGTYSLGTPSGRWSQVFASNSVIGTSDETHKTRPRADTPAETDAYYEIGQLPGVWQWLEKYMVEGDDARLHSGPTVQAAIAVMDKYGLDWREYSAFCYDEWDAQDAIIETWDDEWEVIPGTPAELDEAGNVLVEAVPETRTLIRAAGSNVIQEAREAGSVYAFRKEELLFWISRATIAKQQALHDRLTVLEMKLAS
ncbi:tail fiber domain-containing protein [Klebsiella pneumoniae]|uniref:tail fiber domain-containing protein n=1 Tax=Klebsiella pneumoniae TaxID=573 RepID=UPI001CBE16FB|nr:tail fiber domain-containing protein [Klebsiella pneumoniae]MBZ1829925.1 tail fiber domain-containing protein [Klebsiella pneumoniae]